MRRWAIVLVVTMGMLAAACGSADPASPAQPVQTGPTVAVIPYVPGAAPTATPTPTPTPEPTATRTPQPTAAAAAPELWRAEFRYADVPGTWSRSSVEDQSLMTPSHIVCDGKWLGDPAYYQTTAGIQYSQGDTGPFLLHYLWQSATVAEAQKEMAFTREAFACATWDVTMTSGADIVYHLRPVAIPQVGDESVAVHMTMAVSGKTVLEMQSVYLRVGPVLSEVTLAGGAQSSPALLATLSNVAVQRIHDAGF